MKKLTIREFAHHLSENLKLVKSGERLIILDRKVPIADVIPHQEHVLFPGWRRPIKRVKSKTNLGLSDAIVDARYS